MTVNDARNPLRRADDSFPPSARRFADEALLEAARRIGLLAQMTPFDFEGEVRAFAEALSKKKRSPLSYRYEYAPRASSDLGSVLLRLAREWEGTSPIAALYAERARELALEAAMCEARETPRLRLLARERFAVDEGLGRRADALARAWIEGGAAARAAEALIASDDGSDPRSLVSRLREELGKERLAFKVVVSAKLAALAAVGDRTIQVASGRLVSPSAIERTVRHEIDGHAKPLARAAERALGLLRVGTARGSDHQEGWALLVEDRFGHLGPERKLEIGLRHLAARAAHDGRDPFDAATELLTMSERIELVARSVCRAYRGGGFGREAAYLPAFVAVDEALAEEPALEAVLTSGRVSVAAARVLLEVLPRALRLS